MEVYNKYKKYIEIAKAYLAGNKLNTVIDLPDDRDLSFEPDKSKFKSIDLSWPEQEIKQQGRISSCASHAAMSWFEQQVHEINPKFLEDSDFSQGFSERFHYYFARQLNGTYPALKGMSVRDAFKTMNKYGLCPDELCPYEILKLNDEPDNFAEGFSHFWKIKDYGSIDNTDILIETLNERKSIVVGLKIFSNFESDINGFVPLPDGTLQGGHAMLIEGYDKLTDKFKLLNSWGIGFGKRGYCWIDRGYIDKFNVGMWTGTIEPKNVK